MTSRLMPRTTTPLFLVVLLLLCGRDLLAQFIAPAPTSSVGLNVPRPLTTDPAILFPPSRELTLMPGDLLQVTIFGVASPYTSIGRIGLDGNVNLPLAGVMHMDGLSVSEGENAIAARMEQMQMYRNAQVQIVLSETPGHVVTVLGGAKDTLVPLLGRRRLFDVLSLAGGLGQGVSSVVTIERPGVPESITVDIGNDPVHSTVADIPIFAGDTITMGQVGSYYVVGAVKTPGIQKLNGILPTTVMQAMAVSGGALYQARLNSAKLIRTVGSQRTVVPVEIKKVLNGEAPDPILQTDDILFVPTNKLKAALTIGAITTVLGLAITAIAVTRY